MRDTRKNSNTTSTGLADTYISAIPTILFGVVSMAQLVEVTVSAKLGGVVEVVSSISAVGHKYFSAFSGIVDLLYCANIFCILNWGMAVSCSRNINFEI